MPTRAFGDARYKWSKDIQWVLSEYGCRKPSPILLTPPYVTACPVVTTVEINPETDSFLILATDGLWDEISSENAVDLVAKYKDETHVATELIQEALSKGDEVRLARILGIPSGLSRKFRDDITVNVLFFGESKEIEPNAIYGDVLKDFKTVDFKKAGTKKENLSIWIQTLRATLNQRAKL
jgi:pyruvate dehydrogenase phosphatase